MTSSRIWIFRLTALFVLPVVLLSAIEATLRLLGTGRPTGFTMESRLGQRPMRRENPAFSEQFFPSEIARGPLVLSFPASKAPDTFRVFVLGGSAAQGDPEPSFGFARILEAMLEQRHPGVRFEVINTAVTAINSHVVRRIADELASFDPDLFIVYLGNNEVVGPFGAGTVFAPLSPNLSFIRATIALRSSHLGQAISTLASLLKPRRAALERWRGMEMFLEQRVAADDPRLEDVYGHFRANLEDTLGFAAKSGARAILSTVGTNLRDCAPFASQRDSSLSDPQGSRWDELFREGRTLESKGSHAEAAVRLLAADEIDPGHAELQFILARSLEAQHYTEEPLRRYRLARDLDTLRFRADSRINRIIRDVASEQVDRGVFLVDAERALEASSRDGIPGRELFHDHVHMTFRGNYVVARALLDRVDEILQAPEGRRSAVPAAAASPGAERGGDRPGPAREAMSFEEAIQRLALSDFDRHGISLEMLQRIERPPFVDQFDHRRVLESARREEEVLRRSSRSPDGVASAIRLYEGALQLRNEDPWLHYNFGMLLYGVGRFDAAVSQFRSLLTALPHHPVARERQLAALIQLGRFRESVDESRAALRLDPGFTPARYTLATAHARLGDHEEALAVYRELLRDDPQRAADIYNETGQLLVRLQRYEEAVAAFEKGLEVGGGATKGGRPDITYNLGVALKRAGRTREAAQAFTNAVASYRSELEKHPGSAQLHSALGNVFVESRDFRSAAESFRNAAAADPTNPGAHMNLARSLAAQGRIAEARSAIAAGVAELTRVGRIDAARLLQRFGASLDAAEERASNDVAN